LVAKSGQEIGAGWPILREILGLCFVELRPRKLSARPFATSRRLVATMKR
jgi:hypothetical protein